MNTISSLVNIPNDIDFDAAPSQPVDMAKAAAPRYSTAKAAPSEYSERCNKCGGSGLWNGRRGYSCFACNGEGFRTYRTSPEQRARNAARNLATKAATIADNMAAFSSQYPEESAYIVAKAPTFDFMQSMHDAIIRWGSLTENQIGAVRRCMEKDNARAANKSATVSYNALYEVMQKHSQIVAGEIVIKRARDASTVWVKHSRADKAVGKIEGGIFTQWNRAGIDAEEIRNILTEFDGAPLQTAMKWGKATGRCCMCNRELTDPASIEAGIGPICAGGF